MDVLHERSRPGARGGRRVLPPRLPVERGARSALRLPAALTWGSRGMAHDREASRLRVRSRADAPPPDGHRRRSADGLPRPPGGRAATARARRQRLHARVPRRTDDARAPAGRPTRALRSRAWHRHPRRRRGPSSRRATTAAEHRGAAQQRKAFRLQSAGTGTRCPRRARRRSTRARSSSTFHSASARLVDVR